MITDEDLIEEAIVIRPQPRQEAFLSSPADIVVYGGAAGGGKTFGLLLEPLRHVNNQDFGAVILRRTIPELMKEGGIWDEAKALYTALGAEPNENQHQARFQSGARISFSSLQYESDLLDWRSAQIAMLGFDQLETFTEQMFWYMLSRNRSTSGVAPYVRATCNPEPGWLAELLSWWIDDDGYANLSRVGKIRYFVRVNEKLQWADSRQELEKRFPGLIAKSMTFIVATVYDNPILLEKDPAYLGNLQALSLVDRERLLGDAKRGGNWKIKPAAGNLFNAGWFDIVDAVPAGGSELRFWDFAATEKKSKGSDPDYTASVKAKIVGGTIYILDATEDRLAPAETDENTLNTAKQDGQATAIRFEQEGGASGKRDAAHIVRLLMGFDVRPIPASKDKITRAKPLSAQARAGNVKLLRAPWNEHYIQHMHGQPDLPHDDLMDASSGCYNELVSEAIDWDTIG